jgi:UDP-glucose-4-epimerase GalE
MKKVLVTGGAGFIGSTTAHALAAAGYEPVIFDDFSRGHRSFVEGFEVVEGDVTVPADLDRAFTAGPIDAVIHFAALIEVGESVRDPAAFYRINVGGAACLLGAMKRAGVSRIVFSSTAAVYGTPSKVPIPESAPLSPINPYGMTKRTVERLLADCEAAWDLRFTALRYFNAAGAVPDLPCGEWHEPETHLVPNALRAAAGLKDHLELFGTDHPTPDGTAVRDYVHVADLAGAHVAALGLMEREPGGRALNLGTGRGFSVREVIDAARRVTGRDIPVVERPIREGDPPALVADASRARAELAWTPRHTDIDDIVGSAWEWYKERGFSERVQERVTR